MKKYVFNNKGSVLALTIMVFAVLMIFGTFTLSFMKTENTQSLQHSYKAQAYYYAKSGVEVVEEALISRLYSFTNNVDQQSSFVDKFDVAKEIDVDLDYLTNPVIVKNEIINGKKVLTITNTVTYKNLIQTVKKAIYSTHSMITNQGFLPGQSELFIYLGDVVPQEIQNNGKYRAIPDSYVTKISEEEKVNYKLHPFPAVNWESTDFTAYTYDSINNKLLQDADKIYHKGDFTLSDGMVFNGDFDFYVSGNLYINGDVKFNGATNIYIKEEVFFGNKADIKGLKSNSINQLKIYSYKSMTNTSYSVTANNDKFRVQADLYVNSGNINFGFPKDSQIDGHIIYNGEESKKSIQNINIKTNSMSYSDKLITGSIYAPYATINIGINTYQVGIVLGGQVIGNSINVYPPNVNQANKFYINSTENRITNNPIPIDISSGVDANAIRYSSFFLD